MAITSVLKSAVDGFVGADLKSKVIFNHVEIDAAPKLPVADDFMYDFKYNHALPTSDVLGVKIPDDCDAQKEAASIVALLSKVMENADAQGLTDMFLEYGELEQIAYGQMQH